MRTRLVEWPVVAGAKAPRNARGQVLVPVPSHEEAQAPSGYARVAGGPRRAALGVVLLPEGVGSKGRAR